MNEAVRIHAAWLEGERTGVNFLLTTIPRHADDPAPGPIAAVYDRVRHGWVARHQVPREDREVTLPALAITVTDPATHDPSIATAASSARLMSGAVSIAVQLLARDPDSHEVARDASTYLRAIRGALLTLAAQPVKTREANGIQLVQLTKLQTFHGPIRVDDAVLAGLVVATWSTRETTPL